MDTAITAPSEPEAEVPRLKLHIPPHHPAPGERPDFSYVRRYAAGVTERPDIAVPAVETHPLPYHLILGLDDNGAAGRTWDPQLHPPTLRPGLPAVIFHPPPDQPP